MHSTSEPPADWPGAQRLDMSRLQCLYDCDVLAKSGGYREQHKHCTTQINPSHDSPPIASSVLPTGDHSTVMRFRKCDSMRNLGGVWTRRLVEPMNDSLEGRLSERLMLRCMSPLMAERPEGAHHQWRKSPPGELSIDPVADERLVRVTAWVGAS